MATVSNAPAGVAVGLTAFQRHQKLCSDYLKYYGGAADKGAATDASKVGVRTDHDVLRESYRFIRNPEDDEDGGREVRLALRYYERLFKEYAIADLSLYRQSKVGMRWRVQAEVVAGKGQFTCGTKGCDGTIGLCSYEVNFIYIEAGQRRQALVKLRVCPGCAHKLNYKKEKQYRKASSAAAAVQESQGAKRARRGDAEAHAEAQDAVERHPGSIWDPTSYAPSEPAIMPAGAVKGLPSTTGAEPELGAAAVCVMPGDDSMWETKRKVEEATAEEEVDEYFAGLFD